MGPCEKRKSFTCLAANWVVADLREMEDIYPPHLIEAKMKEIKSWLKEKKIDDLERVALTSDQLEAVRFCEAYVGRPVGLTSCSLQCRMRSATLRYWRTL